MEKVQSSGEATVAVDDTEVILRKNKQAAGKDRQRITSCPDPARLKQLHSHSINMLDLRNICQQGGHFLVDKQQIPGSLHGYQPGEVFSTDKENEETFNSVTENDNTRDRSDNPLTDFLVLLCIFLGWLAGL